MKKQFTINVLLGFIFFGLVACRANMEDNPKNPDVGIPFETFNKSFQITAPAPLNTFKIGDVIGLDIEVIGENPIAFNYDYGSVLFVLADKEWTEIPNFMDYPQGTLILQPARGDALKKGVAVIDPLLPDTRTDVLLRIILIGNIVKDGEQTDERVAGYIDLKLHP